MTYETAVNSEQDSSPIDLFYFVFSNANAQVTTYAYADADRDIEVNGVVYQRAVIKRDNFEKTDNAKKTKLQINTHQDLEVARLFTTFSPSGRMGVIVTQLESEDGGVATLFRGTMVSVKFKKRSAVLNCESGQVELLRQGLQRKYGASCPWLLYGAECGVSRAAHTQQLTMTPTADPRTYTTDYTGADANYFASGTLDVGGVRYLIVAHNGAEITLDQTPPEVITEGTAFAGCLKSANVCTNKFSNIENFGGFPFVPDKSPFETNVF